jgi:hypothetical protein
MISAWESGDGWNLYIVANFLNASIFNTGCFSKVSSLTCTSLNSVKIYLLVSIITHTFCSDFSLIQKILST